MHKRGKKVCTKHDHVTYNTIICSCLMARASFNLRMGRTCRTAFEYLSPMSFDCRRPRQLQSLPAPANASICHSDLADAFKLPAPGIIPGRGCFGWDDLSHPGTGCQQKPNSSYLVELFSTPGALQRSCLDSSAAEHTDGDETMRENGLLHPVA